MALAKIHGGAEIDILNAAELGAELDLRLGPDQRREWWFDQQEIARQRELEHYRGMKPLARDAQLTTPALTRLTITDSIVAEAGLYWVLRLLSAQLASSGSFQAFITTDTDTTKTAAQQRRLVASSGSNNQYQVFTFNPGAAILRADQGLFLNAGANIISYYLSGWEVPAEMIGKLA